MNTNASRTAHARTTRRPFTFRERVLLVVLGGTLIAAASTMTGCAHMPAASDIDRQVAAARTAVTLFELALIDAERRCAASSAAPTVHGDPCAALPDARKALDKAKQAIALTDANRGALASALLGLEQIAQVVDMARRPSEATP